MTIPLLISILQGSLCKYKILSFGTFEETHHDGMWDLMIYLSEQIRYMPKIE